MSVADRFAFGLIAFVPLAGLWLAWQFLDLPGSIAWRSARFQKKEFDRCFRASTQELVSTVRRWASSEGITALEPAKRMVPDQDWTDASLLDLLNQLKIAIIEDDRSRNLSGPDSLLYWYFDSGIGTLHEALHARVRGASRPKR